MNLNILGWKKIYEYLNFAAFLTLFLPNRILALYQSLKNKCETILILDVNLTVI